MTLRKVVTTLVAALGGLVLAGPAAAQTVTLEGGATDEGTHVRLVSDATHPSSAILFTPTAGMTFKDIQTLSAQFNVTDDACAGGAPRFQISFGEKNLHIYLGQRDVETGQFVCAQNTWLGTGNLIGDSELRFDLTQFGGPFYGSYQQAFDLLKDETVTAARLVVDAGWAFADAEQTVLARNVVFDGITVAPTGLNAAQTCKAIRTAMSEDAFRNRYGTNRNKRNAFGKCVSQTAQMKAAERREVANAAVACKAERQQDAAAFRQRFGTGANAFGKCVASKAGTNPVATAAAANRGKGKGRRP